MRELVIGVGEGRVSRDPNAVLVTYALGSCIAIMLHDPITHVAGMAHYMLPESTQSAADSDLRPWKFANTAIPLLLNAALEQGADRRRLIVLAAGGAQVMDDNSLFNIGKRNCLALRKALWKFGLVAHAEDTGGTIVRTARLEVSSGRAFLQSPGGSRWELVPRRQISAPFREASPCR
jgi:chemotaxis protein CheD